MGAQLDVEPAPDRILELGLAFQGAKALLSAVELGLFSELARGPLDAEALRERLGIHARGARDFFDALVALGMLERREGRYFNTPETAMFLDRATPSYVGGWLERANARGYRSWGSLTEALRSGRPQTETGGDFALTYRDPARLRGVLRAMTGHGMGVARALARRFPWGEYRTLVDVGTAEGDLPVQVALAHRHISGGGFDLPPVGPFFEAYVASFGLGERLRFYGGDFFSDPLPGADVLVMGHILHDWDLEQKRALLRKAHAALPPGGALIVYDYLIDDERRASASGLLMSLNMLINTAGGFDYTAAECATWMREAGFRNPCSEHLSGPQSMVVGIK